MPKEARAQRAAELKAEFQRLIDFHEAGFRDIDSKAKYWLTIALPTFVALAGYLYKNGEQMDLRLLVAGYALAASLFISAFLLSSALGARSVRSGILTPPNKTFAEVQPRIESAELWQGLRDMQIAEILRTIEHNEIQNGIKSKWLSRGEASLLRGAPASLCIAGVCTFGYVACYPIRLTGAAPTVAGVGAGIAIGTLSSLVFVVLSHRTTTDKKKNNDTQG